MAAKPVGIARHSQSVIREDEVNEYARLNAEYSRIEKERKALRESLVARIEAGAECPITTPYLLVLTVQDRCTYGWKEICEAVLDLLSDRLRQTAIALIAQLQSEKTEVPQLTVKPNPQWRQA